VEDLADVHAASHEIGTRGVDVVHDQDQPLGRTGGGMADAGAEDDRGVRSGGRALHHPKVISNGEIGVQAPAQVLVEALGRR
jgi:hypothetical protein